MEEDFNFPSQLLDPPAVKPTSLVQILVHVQLTERVGQLHPPFQFFHNEALRCDFFYGDGTHS